jgi:alkaline phosphatase D
MRGSMLAVLMLGLLSSTAAAEAGLLLAVGDVTATAAVVWVRAPAAGDVAVEVVAGDGSVVARARIAATRASDLTGKARVTGLAPGTSHHVRVRAGGTTAAASFRTAPAADQAERVSFIWSGDLGSSGHCRLVDGGYRIFATLARQSADFFLFVGDTIYADHRCVGPGVVPGAGFQASTLDGYRRKHRYNREDASVQDFFRRTPVSAIWDDHEVRNDFAGSAEPLMPAGRQAFLEYWPIVPPAEDPTRLYRALRWGKLLDVFILDTRQYRSPNQQLDGPGKTMLGAAQRRWLLDSVAASDAVWKVVITSVPLSVPTSREFRDGWSNASIHGLPQENSTGFATERDAILKDLRDRGVRNLVFLAADVHHAEIIRHEPAPEFSFHEFIAGPLSARPGRPRPLDTALGPRSLFARGGVFNFGHVVLGPTHLTVRLVDGGGDVMFTHTIVPR